jgi:hypothetical protein
MQTSVLENYLRDLGHLLKSEALEAAESRETLQPNRSGLFLRGFPWATSMYSV